MNISQLSPERQAIYAAQPFNPHCVHSRLISECQLTSLYEVLSPSTLLLSSAPPHASLVCSKPISWSALYIGYVEDLPVKLKRALGTLAALRISPYLESYLTAELILYGEEDSSVYDQIMAIWNLCLNRWMEERNLAIMKESFGSRVGKQHLGSSESSRTVVELDPLLPPPTLGAPVSTTGEAAALMDDLGLVILKRRGYKDVRLVIDEWLLDWAKALELNEYLGKDATPVHYELFPWETPLALSPSYVESPEGVGDIILRALSNQGRKPLEKTVLSDNLPWMLYEMICIEGWEEDLPGVSLVAREVLERLRSIGVGDDGLTPADLRAALLGPWGGEFLSYDRLIEFFSLALSKGIKAAVEAMDWSEEEEKRPFVAMALRDTVDASPWSDS